MTNDNFMTALAPTTTQAEIEGDICFAAHFSAEEDYLSAWMSDEMDAGDALLIVAGLIDAFDLSPETIAEMKR